MEPVAIVSLITALIPFVTALAKKIFKTEKYSQKLRKGINQLIPIVLGIVSSGLYSYQKTNDITTALVIGLGSGGAASSARNVEKNLIGIVNSVSHMISNKKKKK